MRTSGRPSASATSEPSTAYITATINSMGLIKNSTPENARIVKVPFSSSSTNESVIVTNVRVSSAMRWSGLPTSSLSRRR